MNAFVAPLRGMPMLARWVISAAVAAGICGAIAGLVAGLLVYAPTAPFAAVELGLPAALAGGIVGLAAGTILTGVRRIRRHQVNLLQDHVYG